MDQNKVIERVKAAWGGGRGGKIVTIAATDNPRMFTITSGVSFDDERIAATKPTLAAHGLEIRRVETDHFKKNILSVFILDSLWDKLLGETEIQSRASASTSQPIPPADEFDILEKAAEALAGQAADKLRIAEQNKEIEKLKNQLSALTAAPERVYVYQILNNGVTKDDVVNRRRAEGYEIVESGFVPGDSGEPVYCAAMERRDKSLKSPNRMIMSAYPIAVPLNAREIDLVRSGGSNLLEQLETLDDQGLEPALNGLERALYEE